MRSILPVYRAICNRTQVRLLASAFAVVCTVSATGCSESPEIAPHAILPLSLTGSKPVGIGGSLPRRDDVDEAELEYGDWSDEPHESIYTTYSEPLRKGPFHTAYYSVHRETVVAVSLFPVAGTGLKRRDVEQVISELCASYGSTVRFDTPLTEHSPDRIDTLLVWDLGGRNRVALWYWTFTSLPGDYWDGIVTLEQFVESDSLPQRVLDFRQR